MGPNHKAMPKMRAILTTLLPSASPKPISGCPESAAIVETVSSGVDVAKAAMVVATSALANAIMALKKASPPIAASPTAAMMATRSKTAIGMTCPDMVHPAPSWNRKE
jgi:hypothetical protein